MYHMTRLVGSSAIFNYTDDVIQSGINNQLFKIRDSYMQIRNYAADCKWCRVTLLLLIKNQTISQRHHRLQTNGI